jgi:hypothetical protein
LPDAGRNVDERFLRRILSFGSAGSHDQPSRSDDERFELVEQTRKCLGVACCGIACDAC